ncbi:MAG: immunoglobulin domain-containing protein [Bacteroidota bacterium]
MKFILLLTAIMCISLLSTAQNQQWDTQFTSGNAPDGIINCMERIGNNIYVAGSFTTAGGVTVNNIAVWDGSSWDSLASGINGTVYCMAKWNNKLYVGGNFPTADGIPVSNIAMWDGTAWNPLGTGVIGTVLSILTIGDFEVYIGGNMSMAGGVPVSCIAKWDGSVWSSPGTGTNNSVESLVLWDTLVVAGGIFTTAGGAPANRIAGWSGTNWYEIGGGVNAGVYSLCTMQDSLVVAGDFTLAGSTTVNRMAMWDGSGWVPYGTGPNSNVHDILYTGNKLYIAGDFTIVDGISANRVAWYDGANWNTMGDGVNQGAYALAESNGDIFTGGLFTIAGTNPSYYFARWGSLPEITIQPAAYTGCNGDSLSLIIEGQSTTSLSYQWQFNGTDLPGETNDTLVINPLSGTEEGSYNCIVSNQFGDAESDTVNISIVVPPAFSLHPEDSTFCSGADYTMNVTASGTNPALQWQFNGTDIPGANNSFYALTNAGTGESGDYYCIANNICGTDTSDTASVTVHQTPVVTLTGLDTAYCESAAPDTLTGTPAGGIFSGTGMTGNMFDPSSLLGSFTIIYTVTDTTGCQGADSLQTEVLPTTPPAFTGLETTYCFNNTTDTLTGIPSGGTFTGFGMTDSIFDPSLVTPGTFAIFYTTIDTNGCENTIGHYTTVYGPVDALFSGIDTAYCFGAQADTFSVSPSGGVLSGAVNDTIFDPVSAGVGTFEIYYAFTDINSCQNTDTFTVIVYDSPAFSLGNDTSICLMESIDCGPGYISYLWSNGDTLQSIAIPSTGTYGVTVTDNAGCIAADNIYVIILSTPVFDLGDDISISQDQVVIIGTNAGYDSYLWNTGDTSTYIVVDGSTLSVGDHNYWLWIGENSGCDASDTLVVHVTYGIYVPETGDYQGISVFPVPAKDYIEIKHTEGAPEKMAIYDITGNLVMESCASNANSTRLQVTSLSPGNYVLKISGIDYSLRYKLIIVR